MSKNKQIDMLKAQADEAKTIKDLKSVLMETLVGLQFAADTIFDLNKRLKYQEAFHPKLMTTEDFKEFLVEIDSGYLNISAETFENIEFSQDKRDRYVVINKEYYLNDENRERMQRLIKILKANAYRAGHFAMVDKDAHGRGYLLVGGKRKDQR